MSESTNVYPTIPDDEDAAPPTYDQAMEEAAQAYASMTPGAQAYAPMTPGAQAYAPMTPGAQAYAPMTPGATVGAPGAAHMGAPGGPPVTGAYRVDGPLTFVNFTEGTFR